MDAPSPRQAPTLEKLIDLHIEDMCSVGNAPKRTKAYCLELLKRKLGHVKVQDLRRDLIVAFAKTRAQGGAGPVSISMDLTYLKT
ncbi:MAG: site-specific integrase, partial [Hyphomicrobiaceae bacterium]